MMRQIVGLASPGTRCYQVIGTVGEWECWQQKATTVARIRCRNFLMLWGNPPDRRGVPEQKSRPGSRRLSIAGTALAPLRLLYQLARQRGAPHLGEGRRGLHDLAAVLRHPDRGL